MLSLFQLKIISAFGSFSLFLAIGIFTFCLIARLYRRRGQLPTRPGCIAPLLNGFTTGVFLAVCFMGLFHSSQQKFTQFTTLIDIDWLRTYPLTELNFCCSLLCAWLCDHLCVMLFSGSSGVHHNENTPFGAPDSQDDATFDDNEDELLTSDSKKQLLQGGLRRTKLRPLPARVLAMSCHSPELSAFTVTAACILTYSMSCHAFLEGVGIGLMNAKPQVIAMLVGSLSHETLCVISLSCNLGTTSTMTNKRRSCLALLFCFCIMTASGIGLGSLIFYLTESSVAKSASNLRLAGVLCSAILQGFAAATFAFVIFIKLLAPVIIAQQGNNILHWTSTLVGLALMAIVRGLPFPSVIALNQSSTNPPWGTTPAP